MFLGNPDNDASARDLSQDMIGRLQEVIPMGDPKKLIGAKVLPWLGIIAVLLVLAGAGYGLYLLKSLTIDIHVMTARLDKIDNMAGDIGKLSDRMALLEDTNKQISRMENYMKYLPQLAKTGTATLAVSQDMSHKFDTASAGISQTQALANNAAAEFTSSMRKFDDVRSELIAMRRSSDTMAQQVPAIGKMCGLLQQSNASILETQAGLKQLNGGIDKVGSNFGDMQTLLQGMNNKLAVIPEMKQSLDKTNNTLTTAMNSLTPLGESLPKLNTSIEQMNQTTQEMAKSIKKQPRQGAIGIAILTAAGLIR